MLDKVKDNQFYIEKIKEDLSFIIEHTKGKTQKQIESNDLLLDSIMFRLIQIAENNDKLTEEFKKKNSTIPWRAMKGMRNTIVHDYGVVDLSIVYDTVINSVPKYLKQLNDIK